MGASKGIVYYPAADVEELLKKIVTSLNFVHIDCRRIKCYRSKGSKSRYISARIYGLSKIWQQTLNMPPSYIIEVISENYDKQAAEEKEKIIIHEALHIPKGFRGGFRPHKGNITKKRIENLHALFKEVSCGHYEMRF